MKILSISTHQERCGIATYNGFLCDSLSEIGADIDIFPIDSQALHRQSKAEVLKYFSPLEKKIDSCDAIVVQHEYGLFGGRFSSGFAQRVFYHVLAKIARAEKPTLIIFHSDPVLSDRWLSRKRYYWKGIRELILKNEHISLIVHGEEAKRKYVDAGLPAGRIRDVKHPLPPVRDLVRVEEADRITLTIFGFVAKYKGYDQALEAFEKLPENFHLIVAGSRHPGLRDDDTLDRIESAQRGELAGRITITGWLDEAQVPEIMAKTDIVLAPYHVGGPAGSGAITWAISHGRPIIASDTRTFRDIQQEGNCLALVPAGDAKALRDKILELHQDEVQRTQLIENCMAYAKKHSWPAFAAEVSERLRTLVPLPR